MCEIPANVVLADEFAKRFDGFSIDSNDLTQLTLGIDRDSADLAYLFDERNEAVKEMIRTAVRAAHKADTPSPPQPQPHERRSRCTRNRFQWRIGDEHSMI